MSASEHGICPGKIYTSGFYFDEDKSTMGYETNAPAQDSVDIRCHKDVKPRSHFISNYEEEGGRMTSLSDSIACSSINEEHCCAETDYETSSWTGASTVESRSVLDTEVGLTLLRQLRRLQMSLDHKSGPTKSTGDILRHGKTGCMVLRTNSAYRVWSIFIQKKFDSQGLRELYSYAMSDGPDKYFSEEEESRALQILVENMSVNFHKILYGQSSVVHCLRSVRDRCKPDVIEKEAYVALLRIGFGDINNPINYFQRVRSLLANVSPNRDIRRDETKLLVILRSNFAKPYKRSSKDCTTLTQLETKITTHWIQRKISLAHRR